jgi:hypothetical protein
MFEVRQTLKPGALGTRKLAARFGDKLVCIRYRVDPARAVRYTTVELVVDQAPLARRKVRRAPSSVPDRNPMVAVKIFFREDTLREKAKEEGAIWRPRQKLWEMPLQTARRLGLGSRIVSGGPPQPLGPSA